MEEVKIPIVLEVQDTKEVTSTLEKLQKKASQINEMRKVRQNSFGGRTSDLKSLERSIDAVKNYAKAIEELSKKEGNDSVIKSRISSINDEVSSINEMIKKYKELGDVLKTTNSAAKKSSSGKKKSTWVNTDNPKELDQYIKALKGKLKQIGDLMKTAPKGKDNVVDDTTARMQREIAVIDELIAKIGEYQTALANAKSNAQQQYDTVAKMRKDGTEKEALAEQEAIWKEAKKTYSDLQRSSAQATRSIKVDIKERIHELKDEEKALREVIMRMESIQRVYESDDPRKKLSSNGFRESAKNISKPAISEEEEEKYLESLEELSQAEKNLAVDNEKLADSNTKVSKSSKEAASTLYYQLRAFKMLGFVVNSAKVSMGKFGSKAIDVAKRTASAYAKLLPGVSLVSLAMKRNAKSASTFGKGLGKVGKDIKSHTKDVKSATQEHNHFNFSLKSALKTILAYGLGIRSLYMLMRKLRSAISSGFEEMAQQFDDVNQKMSSIVSSINYIKASLTAMVEPLLGVIAPALEKISEIVSNISYHVASFIAALTGQTAVYKAIRVQTDYAKSLDKTAEKAKKAKKELAGFDELNVLHSDDDDEDNKDYTMGWELVPVLEEAFPLLDKIKDILSKLFEPLKNAWEKMKDFVINSFKFMVEKLKSLLKTIWEDFLKVWQEEATQKIFENLLKILGDIFLIIGYIAEAIEEAWRHNDNGLRILRAIRDIIGIIVDALMRCADATVEWAKELNITPLFTAIAEVLKYQIVPAVQKIADLFVYLYIYAVLPLAKYLIEEFAPVIVRAFGDVAEAIGNIAERIQKALETNNILNRIVTGIEGILDIIAEGFAEIARLTKEWSERLDFVPLFETFADVLNRQVVPALRQVKDLLVYLFDKVILSTAEYIIETLGPIILSIAGNISELIGIIAEKLRLAFEENNRGIRIVTALHGIITLIAEVIDRCTEKTTEWANKLQLSPLVETFTQVLETQVLPAVSKIVGLFEHLYDDIILEIVRYAVEQFGPAFVQIFGNISETVGIIADRFRMASEENDRGSQILEKIEGIISYIMDKIIQVSEKTKEWASNLDFAPLLDAINRNLDSIKPLIEFIVDTVGKFWTDVLLPFWQYIIEDGGPRLLDLLGDIAENTDWDSLSDTVDNLFDAMEKFLELSWDVLLELLKDIGEKIEEISKSGKLDAIIDGFKKWMTDADPAELADKIEKFVKIFAEVYAGLTVVSKVISPVITGFLTLANVFAQTGIINSIKGLTTVIGGGAAGSGAGLVGSLGSIAVPVLIVVAVLGTMVAAFGGVKGTIEELKKQFDLIKESVTQFAEGLNFQATLDNLKTSFDSLGDSVQLLAPIFDLVLTVIGEQIASLIKGALGLIDGILQAFDGVATFFNGVAAIVDGFVALLTGNHKLAMDKFGEGISKLFIGVAEVVGGAINSIAEAIAGFVGVVCPDAAKGILDFVNMTKGVFKSMKEAVTVETEETATKVVDDFNDMNTGVTTIIGTHTLEETGSDYIKGFETGEVSAFESFRSQYDKSLDDLVSDTQNVINENTLNPPGKDYISGLNEGIYSEYEPFNTHYMQSLDELLKENTDLFNSDTLYKPGNEFITGLDTGVKDEWPNFSQTTDTNLQELTDKMNEVINDETLREPGQNYIKGLHDAMMLEWAELREDIDYSIGQLMATFQSRLNSEALYDVGANLIRGLRDGLMSELEETLERVREICEEIKETAEEAFEVASPSKVFFRIGSFLMQGMSEGIDSSSEEALTSLTMADEQLLLEAENLKTGFNGLSTTVTTEFSNMFTGINTMMMDPTLLMNVTLMMQTLTDTILNGFLMLTEMLMFTTFPTFLQMFHDNLNMTTLVEDGTMFMMGFTNSVNEGWNNFVIAMTANVDSLSTYLADSFNEETLVEDAELFMAGWMDTIADYWAEFISISEHNVEDYLTFMSDNFNANTLVEEATQFITSFCSIIGNTWANFSSSMYHSVTNFLGTLGNTLLATAGQLVSTGGAVLDDASATLIAKLQQLLGEVRELCEAIIEQTKRVFQIGSPSKVFEDIGMYVVQGFEIGLLDNLKDTKEAYQRQLKKLSPSPKELEEMRKKQMEMQKTLSLPKEIRDRDKVGMGTYLDYFQKLSKNSVDIVHDMVESINDELDNLDFLSGMESMYALENALSHLSPSSTNIATGKYLPSSSEFTNVGTAIDAGAIASAVKDAVIESMSSMSYNNSESGDIVLQVDGYELFRATRNQNDRYRYSTGYSAF